MNLKERILFSGRDDWMYLGEIASHVCKYLECKNELDVIDPTINIIGEMVSDGLLEIGNISTGVFKSWDTTLADSLMKIKQDWISLGAPLNISDVCWLANTPKGDEIASTIIEDEPEYYL
jgi:hypothetical protein